MTHLFVTQEDVVGSSNYNSIVKRCHRINAYLNANEILVREYIILARRDKTPEETIRTLRQYLGASTNVMYFESDASFYQILLNSGKTLFVIPDNRSVYCEQMLNFTKDKQDNIFLYKIHNLFEIEKEES